MSEIVDLKLVKDKSPSVSASKRVAKFGFDLELNNYMQLLPKDIHLLSKTMSEVVNQSKNILTSFDNEVLDIKKEKNSFIISSSTGKNIECKRLIVCVGRSGWRWATDLYRKLGIIETNDIAKFGIRIEASADVLKDFNKSNCTLKKNDLEIGPLCWGGTVIPEDHCDMAISSFRSNEARWKTDKVSFNVISSRIFKNSGIEQVDRIGQLTFILTNERVLKEKLSLIATKKSKISVISEYDWLFDAINEVSSIMPDIVAKGYYHVPTIFPMIPKIKIGSNLVTDLDGVYAAGESAGVSGILSAACMGITAADSVSK
jgi:hypothetical protein